jgi:SAM-dependent methyltransferase
MRSSWPTSRAELPPSSEVPKGPAGAPEPADIEARLARERATYADRLAEVDGRVATASTPVDRRALQELLGRLNDLWDLKTPVPGGILAFLRQQALEAVRPLVEQQRAFNATLVQALNGQAEEGQAFAASVRESLGSLVRHLQQVEPLMDARARAATALATERAELILEAFDRRQESLGRRLEGLLALRDRVESVSEEALAIRRTLEAGAPPPAVASTAAQAARDSAYTAFENRFRGSREEIRDRLRRYVELLSQAAPVVDLGCGRGEMLELLREAGIAARGVEGNLHSVQDCRSRGLDVVEGDLLDFLRRTPEGSQGGLFAAQVAEHLPPPVLLDVLRESHRALRAGGLLILETPNPRSVIALHEVFLRDLTHERPLHPETLRFLAASAGFSEVRIEMQTPVEGSTLLRQVPPEGLPEAVAQAVNENVGRLNAFLFGPLDYALIARR